MNVSAKEHDQFALTQGNTLQVWQNIEGCLFWVFKNAEHYRLLATVQTAEEAKTLPQAMDHAVEFDKLEYFSKRLVRTNESFKSVFDEPEIQNWRKVKKLLWELNDKRIQLVHWQPYELRLENGTYKRVLMPQISALVAAGTFDLEPTRHPWEMPNLSIDDLLVIQEDFANALRQLQPFRFLNPNQNINKPKAEEAE